VSDGYLHRSHQHWQMRVERFLQQKLSHREPLAPGPCTDILKGSGLNQKKGHFDLKGLVHPTMKIKSLITHPHTVPTP